MQPQFAHFFLAFMMGRYNFTGLVNDLQSLDSDLFKNLMFLKTYEVRVPPPCYCLKRGKEFTILCALFDVSVIRQGDIRDLGLTFSVTDDSYGSHREVELFPGNRKETKHDVF